LNSKEFKKLDGNRKYLFEKFEKPLLKPLPQESFEFMTWKKARVNINYHIELEKHYYSVPHKYIRKEVELAYSINCVNIFNSAPTVFSLLLNSTNSLTKA
jgi:hypothetical protein